MRRTKFIAAMVAVAICISMLGLFTASADGGDYNEIGVFGFESNIASDFSSVTVSFAVEGLTLPMNAATVKISYDSSVLKYTDLSSSLFGVSEPSSVSDDGKGTITVVFDEKETNGYTADGAIIVTFSVKSSNRPTQVGMTVDGNILWVFPGAVKGSATAEVTFCHHEHTNSVTDRYSTCEQHGYFSKYCEDCGILISRMLLPFAEHILKENPVRKVDSSCTAKGYAEYVCSVCGIIVRDMIPAAHKFIKQKNPGLAKYDEYINICAECSLIENSPIQCEHDASCYEYYKRISAASCSNNGRAIYKCSVCGAEGEMVVPAGHTFECTDVLEEPTPTSSGRELWVCTGCGMTRIHTTDFVPDETTETTTTETTTATETTSVTSATTGATVTETATATETTSATTATETTTVTETTTETETVTTTETTTDSTETTQSADGGCGSAIGAGTGVMCVVLLLGVCLTTKKRK